MSKTVERVLTSGEMQQVIQQRNAIANVSLGSGAPAAGKFTFLGFFDGTNNNKSDLPLSGLGYKTNVANLYDQAELARATNVNLVPRYYQGIGTGGDAGNQLNAGLLPTSPAIQIAEVAFAEFRKLAIEFLDSNPNAIPDDIVISGATFSRGYVPFSFFAVYGVRHDK